MPQVRLRSDHMRPCHKCGVIVVFVDCLSHQMFMLLPRQCVTPLAHNNAFKILHTCWITWMWFQIRYFIDQMCDWGGGGGGVLITEDHHMTSSPDGAASPPSGRSLVSYLMQLSGSRSQSVLHMNLSQCSQPIVGCRARPLSSASAAGGGTKPRSERRNTPPSILIHF